MELEEQLNFEHTIRSGLIHTLLRCQDRNERFTVETFRRIRPKDYMALQEYPKIRDNLPEYLKEIAKSFDKIGAEDFADYVHQVATGEPLKYEKPLPEYTPPVQKPASRPNKLQTRQRNKRNGKKEEVVIIPTHDSTQYRSKEQVLNGLAAIHGRIDLSDPMEFYESVRKIDGSLSRAIAREFPTFIDAMEAYQRRV
ncbi:MAG: hypothetical protein ACMXYF_04475 [Candidatus Woesearchaeota archaeon]